MKDKRKYEKRNTAYWNSFGKGISAARNVLLPPDLDPDMIAPSFEGGPFYISQATYARNSVVPDNRGSRSAVFPRTDIYDKFSNIDDFDIPFKYDKLGHTSVKDPIILCQKAYFHIPIFKNTVDIMSELSSTDLVLSGGTKGSRAFVKKWMKSAKIEALKNQFFREYYRSGNVFVYRMFGDFTEEEIRRMKTIYAADTNLIPVVNDFPEGTLPIRYVILNPVDIVGYESLGSATHVFKKLLNKFEAMRLSNPTSAEEKKLADNIQKNDPTGALNLGLNDVYVTLEPNKLVYVFYKKQDYEPFAVPFGYPILRDLNWKLELKRIDQSVSRSLENIILLITMGTEPDKGGINPKNMQAMKDLFSNEVIGRVLVADYTTQAKFLVPEIDAILGKQKYEIVNQDIKEGLQNIFFEDAKYANSEIKVKIFFEKLAEGKEAFINEFLQPEIEKVCAAIGFRDYPHIRFKSSNIFNEAEIQKAAIRLMELGVLVPKQGIESLNNKELPDSTEVGEGQEEYVKQRKDGQYTPLIGGAPLYEMPIDGSGAAPTAKPAGLRGRPTKNAIAEELISAKAVAQIAQAASVFEEKAIGITKASKKAKALSEEQLTVVKDLCRSIVESNEVEDWEKVFRQCSNGSGFDKLNLKPEVSEISQRYQTDTYGAALIYHSQKQKKSVDN